MVGSIKNLLFALVSISAFVLMQGCAKGHLQFDQASTSSNSEVSGLNSDDESQSSQLQFNGQLNAFDEDGQINGQITVSHQAVSNTSSVKVKFFSFYRGEKTYIGSYNIDVRDLLGGQSSCHASCNCSCNDNSITFPFIFLVPQEYRCHSILAFLVDPVSGDLVQIPAHTGFLNKKKNRCSEDPQPTPGPTPGPTPNPEPVEKPAVDIDHLYTSGRVVEIAGTCKEGAGDLTFTGDILNKTSAQSTCNSGSFVHCAIAKKPFQQNDVTVTQTNSKGKSADDTDMFILNHPPIVKLTIDSLEISANGKKAKIMGECTTGAKLTLNIYNEDIATLTCVDGEYEYEDIKLVNVANRYIYVTQVTSFGTTTRIWADVDGKNTDINCGIDDLVSNELICKNAAGTVSGSCHPGLPVRITVDGKLQEYAYCDSSGEFVAENILLNNLGEDNNIKIKQVSPFGKTCSETVKVQQF